MDSVEEVAGAIRSMVVRGAPAIGIAAAYGFVMALDRVLHDHQESWRQRLDEKVQLLRASRPTAVNLAWAIDRMQLRLDTLEDPSVKTMLQEAVAIHEEDIRANRTMGGYGAEILKRSPGVLTHCNTGSLATGGFGTALGVIRTAWANGQIEEVYISETRPWLQGSRLTAWELEQDRIPGILVADSTAAFLMQTGKVNWVITGADRVAANGDVANKIGTYSHAVNARHHGLGFMVVAPVSTIDLETKSGKEIRIEERDPDELRQVAGNFMTPKTVRAFNPVFDITPSSLVSFLVTELGAIEAPNEEKIRRLLGRKKP
jgi:methylthioribose-1-phosphate isomerase